MLGHESALIALVNMDAEGGWPSAFAYLAG